MCCVKQRFLKRVRPVHIWRQCEICNLKCYGSMELHFNIHNILLRGLKYSSATFISITKIILMAISLSLNNYNFCS